MAAFGDVIGALAKRAAHLLKLDKDGDVRDWSVDIAIHLALAFYAFNRLKESGAVTTLGKRQLLVPALEQTWREFIYIRLHLDPSTLTNDIARPFTISKTGRIIDGSEISDKTFQRYYWNGNRDSKRRKGDAFTYRKKLGLRPTSFREHDPTEGTGISGTDS